MQKDLYFFFFFSEITCVFRNCLPSNIVMLYPMLPVNMTLTQFGDLVPDFKNAKKKFSVTSPLDYKNYTAVEFAEEQHCE